MRGVQRFLSGHKNEVRTAALLTGPVKPITDAVVQKPIARQGSSSAKIDGTFVGTEQAEYEIEVLDRVPTVPLITAPIFSGVGNGNLQNVAVIGLGAREVEVELADLGQILKAASSELQGVQVVVKTPGAAGNLFKLRVDRSGLVFTPQAFSLLKELKAGETAMKGPEFDWDTKYMGSDGVIPANAHRIAFGSDTNNVYVQYKKQVDGEFSYQFEPAIKQTYAVKSVIQFVTGGYTVRLYEVVAGVDTLRETYAGVVTLYDLLNAIKTTSAYLLVQGGVAFDRTAGGQALLELVLNTDARAVSNTGSGSQFATGFVDVVVNANAATELIEATCIAATFKDSPGAGLGNEMWEVRGSVSGVIRANIQTGQLINGDTFEARIPQKVPDGYVTLPKGSFVHKETIYNETKRVVGEGDIWTPPKVPICMDSLTLGLNAQEQLITLTYRKRPVADACACTADNTQALDPACLGILTNPEGGTSMAYAAATVTRLVSLYDWFATTVRNNSFYFSDDHKFFSGGLSGGPYVMQDPFVSMPTNNPLQQTRTNFAYISLFDMIKRFEETLASVDKLTAGALKVAAEAAWDAAVTELKADVDTNLTGPGNLVSEVHTAFEALAAGDAVSLYEEPLGTKYWRKARPADFIFGFVKAAFGVGVAATGFFYGANDSITSTETTTGTGLQQSWTYLPSITTPGKWVLVKGATLAGDPPSIAASIALSYVAAGKGYRQYGDAGNTWGYALLADRYRARLQHVLISGGISPLGKDSANLVSGDGCWQDWGGAYWWEVTGGNDDAYAPAFTGHPYYSAKKFPGGVVVNGVTTPSEGFYGTKEFGFIIDVTCPEHLIPGDTVILRIGNAAAEQTYQKGDKLQLGIVSAQDIAFFGGNNGDNIQTWFVTDSVSGPRAPYLLDLDVPLPYNDGALAFEIVAGTLPFAKGDKFKFAIEGGHYRWRKTVGGVVGGWSASTAINVIPLALDSGLSLHFTLGTSPAFFTGDLYKFTALQPYALSNIIKPDFDMWQWGAVSPAPGVIDFANPKNIEAIGIAFHTIPAGATILVEGGVAAGVYTWAEPIVWAKDVIGKLLAVTRVARYVRITLTNAQGGGIGWLFLGTAIAFTHSAQVSINREYRVNRSTGLNPASAFKGKGVGSQIQWPEGSLHEDDYAPLLEMLDWLKSQDDEALMFFPQETRQTEVVLGTVESDAIAFNDVFNFQPDAAYDRRLSATIPLKGVSFR